MKALLIGIDAGCLPVFEQLYEEDVIPRIESVCTNGVCGPLESQIPPWTPSAWPSVYTGVNPGKHGIFGFIGFDGYDYHVVTGSDVHAHRLWTLLDYQDLSSVIVNVPVTHPPDPVDGAIIPGFIGPENPPCHPEGILEEVRDAIGEYRVYPKYAREDDTYTDEEKMNEYCTLVSMRGRAFRYLADRFEPEFGFIEFQKTDTVFHEFVGDWEKVKQVYKETDWQIGQIIDKHDPETIFIASDHGMGRYERDEFRVNSYLRDHGYVETKQGGAGMPTWNQMRTDLRAGDQVRTEEHTTIKKFTASLAEKGITPNRVAQLLEQVGLAEFARKYAPSGIVRAGAEQVDFPASTAFMRARTELGIRLNVAGREPSGIISPEEYEDVRTDLIELLRSASTPNGAPVFQEVVPREEYFHGSKAEKAVDIVTVPNNFQHFMSAQIRDELFGPPTEPWNHKLEGIFAAKGNGINDTAVLDDPHLLDVAPTILSALGIPLHHQMDGKTLPVVSPTPVEEYPEYSPAEFSEVSDGVEDRLADLGYMS